MTFFFGGGAAHRPRCVWHSSTRSACGWPPLRLVACTSRGSRCLAGQFCVCQHKSTTRPRRASRGRRALTMGLDRCACHFPCSSRLATRCGPLLCRHTRRCPGEGTSVFLVYCPPPADRGLRPSWFSEGWDCDSLWVDARQTQAMNKQLFPAGETRSCGLPRVYRSSRRGWHFYCIFYTVFWLICIATLRGIPGGHTTR